REGGEPERAARPGARRAFRFPSLACPCSSGPSWEIESEAPSPNDSTDGRHTMCFARSSSIDPAHDRGRAPTLRVEVRSEPGSRFIRQSDIRTSLFLGAGAEVAAPLTEARGFLTFRARLSGHRS